MANTSSLLIISVIVVLSIMHGSNAQEVSTSSATYLTCIDNCQTTPQFNPVCGTDGITYYNQYKLECAQRCGHTVEMRRLGACKSSAGGK